MCAVANDDEAVALVVVAEVGMNEKTEQRWEVIIEPVYSNQSNGKEQIWNGLFARVVSGGHSVWLHKFIPKDMSALLSLS